jgi:RimJ/RimL family protein N-acetyltransferase
MVWHLTDSADEFHRVAGDYLRARPVEHTIPLTVVDTLRKRGPHQFGSSDPFFGWWQDDAGGVRGAFLRTPPYPLYVTAAPAVPELVELLADRPLPGVNAPARDAELIADAWRRRTGTAAEPGARFRLYRLDALTPPADPPGAPRVAAAADRDLLIAWMTAFHDEIGENLHHSGGLVDDRLSYEGVMLWEVDGSPVSMASVSRVEAGMLRVLAVYTPKDLRGHGYAGAVTSAVSRAALDAGAEHVVLFADLTNPTSNALYQRLGYRPIEDRTVMEFKP